MTRNARRRSGAAQAAGPLVYLGIGVTLLLGIVVMTVLRGPTPRDRQSSVSDSAPQRERSSSVPAAPVARAHPVVSVASPRSVLADVPIPSAPTVLPESTSALAATPARTIPVEVRVDAAVPAVRPVVAAVVIPTPREIPAGPALVEQVRCRLISRMHEDWFITCLAADPASDTLVGGSEDQGLFVLSGKDGGMVRFTTNEGLAENSISSIAIDAHRRLWAGYPSRGVGVLTGKTWRNFSVLDGPIGNRVNAIAMAADGDVWMGTEGGVSRYSLQRHVWSHHAVSDGLPDHDVAALACGRQGDALVGFRIAGVLCAERLDTPSSWRGDLGHDNDAILHPDASRPATGPSRFVNCALITTRGAYLLGTVNGVYLSRDRGVSWENLAGADRADKLRNRYRRPGEAAVARAQPVAAGVLAEDYVTCMAEDDAGRIWIGHRHAGIDVFDPERRTIARCLVDWPIAPGSKEAGYRYATAIVALGRGRMAVGWYGDGLTFIEEASPPARLPDPPPPPGRRGREAQLVAVTTDQAPATLRRQSEDPSFAVAGLPDDWRTQGDWLGRYGQYWAVLCAMRAPNDYVWGCGYPRVRYCAFTGPHQRPFEDTASGRGELLRHWIHWPFTDTVKSLELPPTYRNHLMAKGLVGDEKRGRRQSEWDDHGEAYELTFEGPSMYCNLVIPEGQFVMSLYFMNKDGHQGMNRLRDYIIRVRENASTDPFSKAGIHEGRVLQVARVKDFWHGVWKRFVITGPRSITIEIDRNHSFNTIVSAVTVDPLSDQPVEHVTALGGGASTRNVLPFPAGRRGVEGVLAQLENDARSAPRQWAAAYAKGYKQVYDRLSFAEREDTRQRLLQAVYHRLGFREEAEKLQTQSGLRTAREIERAIIHADRREDGTDDYSGQESALLDEIRRATAGVK